VSVYKSGAFDYLPKPFDLDEMNVMVERAFEFKLSNLDETTKVVRNSSGLIGKAATMQKVFKAIGKLSKTEMTVLIRGESGTGKELVAKAIHDSSMRSKGKFVAINMAAIPSELVESELFGHEKGAFTGAVEKHIGWFEQANNGTLFLDEIGDMPMSIQTKVLRVLAENKFHRVGGTQAINSNIRLLAATHQPLEEFVVQGKFRKDLYHRLNVVKITIPSLNERVEDIPLLVDYFLTKIANEMQVPKKSINQELLQFLSKLNWPGNVRELENLCRWLTVMASSMELQVRDLPIEFQNRKQVTKDWISVYESWLKDQIESKNDTGIRASQDLFEKTLLSTLLQSTDGHRQKTAKILGWGRNTVTRKIHNYGLDKNKMIKN